MFDFEYMQKVTELVQLLNDSEKDKIRQLARIFADNIASNHMIHTFGTGHSHMIGIELFARAGGLGNVNAMLDPDTLTMFGCRRSGAVERLEGLADIIYDNYRIEKGDIIIISSNSGRNALPIEMAMRAKKEGIYVVAVTNLHQSMNSTSRHSSGKRLFEIADMVLDTHVPDGDAMMEVGGIKTGPASTVASVVLLNTVASEALKLLAAEGKPMPVFQSQNVDGANNDAIYLNYQDRAKGF